MGFIRSLCSVSTLATCVFLAYLGGVILNFHRIMFPMSGIEVLEGDKTIENLWQEGSVLRTECFLSRSLSLNVSAGPAETLSLASAQNLTYNMDMSKHSFQLNLTRPGIPPGVDSVELSPEMWNPLMHKKPLYLHVVVHLDDSGDPALLRLHAVLQLTKMGPRPKYKPLRYLLRDPWGEEGIAEATRRETLDPEVNFWKPQAAVRLVADFTKYLETNMPPILAHTLEIVRLDASGRKTTSVRNMRSTRYRPPIHLDETGLTSDMYVPLNGTVDSLPLHITLEPMSLPRWQLMQTMESSLRAQKEQFGFGDSDIDDLRRLVSDTSVLLLLATLVASTLHLLFEFLAFKSDVQFWRNNKSLEGLSIRSIAAEFVFQSIILLYLVEDGASMLVSVPSGVGILIQAWKLRRATGLCIVRSSGALCGYRISMPRLEKEDRDVPPREVSSVEQQSVKSSKRALTAVTLEYDRLAVVYLSMLLLPPVVGFSIKSLTLDLHASWYGWAIKSLTGCVYTLGFVLMTPQLFINYKLKSVAHLPWRFLCYRFSSTFIDDMFAFLIKMPLMHRLSCFRDDIVFFMYLYQRWKYPVDANRPMAVEDRGS